MGSAQPRRPKLVFRADCSSVSDKVTAEAGIADPGIFSLLRALGEELSPAMREVYAGC